MNKIYERKSTATITVKKDGNILANTEIKIRQTNHEFLFGCSAFDFVGKAKFEAEENPNPAALTKYKEIKCHPLCWHTACCDWLLKYDNKTILEK